jgi:hypothetical protein
VSAGPKHPVGPDGPDGIPDSEMSVLPGADEPGWYEDDTPELGVPPLETPDPGDPAWETPDPGDPAWETLDPGNPVWEAPDLGVPGGKPWTFMTRATAIRLRVPRSRTGGGLMGSRLIRCWPRWWIWCSVMGWGSWMMIS